MIIKTPPIESELFLTWEKYIEKYPEYANAPDIVKEQYEKEVDDLFAAVILMSGSGDGKPDGSFC